MIQEILSKIQTELVAPKSKFNSFGKYAYRNIEDLTNAIKPLLKQHNAALVMSDEIINIADRVYVRATATLHAGGEQIEAIGWAREAADKKGMDDSQITGSTSSYARKYAFSGLFAIDGEKDADDEEKPVDSNAEEQKKQTYKEQARDTANDTNLQKWLDWVDSFTLKTFDEFIADWDKYKPSVDKMPEMARNKVNSAANEMKKYLMEKAK